MTDELKLCPFCGENNAEITENKNYPVTKYGIKCGSCHNGVDDYYTLAEAIKRWNNRPLELDNPIVQKMKARCICVDFINCNPDPVPNPDCPIHGTGFRVIHIKSDDKNYIHINPNLNDSPIVEAMTELIKTYDEYLAMIGEELHELVPLANLHGWKSSQYLKGVVYRDNIAKLTEAVKALKGIK